MQLLLAEVTRLLEDNSFCVVMEADLTRVWPKQKGRTVQMRKFAEDNGWELLRYAPGYGALIFKKFAARA